MSPKSKHWIFTINNPQDEFKVDKSRVDYYVYQYEQAPTTGTLHIQGYLYLKRATTFNGVRALLPTGSHVELCRDPEAAIVYCSKEDTRIAGPCEYGNKPNFSRQGLLEHARTKSRAEFMEHCHTERVPFGYYSEALRIGCPPHGLISEVDLSTKQHIKPPLAFFTLPEENEKAVVIEGPTGIGKTSWAKYYCRKPALMISHMDDLKHISPETKALIFDDMDFRHMPRTAQIHLVDFRESRSIHIRYGTATIPSGIQKIFTCNEYPFVDDPAIKRRVFLIKF